MSPLKVAISPDLLLRAYTLGIFPMAEHADDQEVLWVRPQIRGIIPLDAFHIPRSLRKLLRQKPFEMRYDYDFSAVIAGCGGPIPGRSDSWINKPIREAYRALFHNGDCHTVEAWRDGHLAGGLYGVALGRAFFGESMFSLEPNASKICLVYLVKRLQERGFMLLDTQFTTPHLKRFGAIDVPRPLYEELLAQALQTSATF